MPINTLENCAICGAKPIAYTAPPYIGGYMIICANPWCETRHKAQQIAASDTHKLACEWNLWQAQLSARPA